MRLSYDAPAHAIVVGGRSCLWNLLNLGRSLSFVSLELGLIPVERVRGETNEASRELLFSRTGRLCALI
ncbi:MAG: hypothetical protein ACJAZO_002381 [Myxococcota bacterium]|jgi:hypothetical protein